MLLPLVLGELPRRDGVFFRQHGIRLGEHRVVLVNDLLGPIGGRREQPQAYQRPGERADRSRDHRQPAIGLIQTLHQHEREER